MKESKKLILPLALILSLFINLLYFFNIGNIRRLPFPATNQGTQGFQEIRELTSVKEYQDVRWKDLRKIESQLDTSMIKTFWFNEQTIWPKKYATFAKNLLIRGMNPGLGIRNLHKQGIIGTGVTVAIIDQNICLDHPEYSGKIIEYHDVGCNQPSNKSSMHGPAVASLLVGDSIGTAPGAKIYFVAAPSWTGDARYQAAALNWIIDKNKSLPEGKKIRAVSISAAPSGPGSPFDKNNKLWDTAYAKAISSGLIIIDCTQNFGITGTCHYDIDDPDNVKLCISDASTSNDTRILIPCSLRTTAQEYDLGKFSYQFTGRGGLSWAEPYLVGVLALGWQLRPDISGNEMLKLIFSTAYKDNYGSRFIQPNEFINAVKSYHN